MRLSTSSSIILCYVFGPVHTQSPFLEERPTADLLLERFLGRKKPLVRGLQPFQLLMRGGLGRRVDGVDLSFLREQDTAFTELQASLSGKIKRQQEVGVIMMHTVSTDM